MWTRQSEDAVEPRSQLTDAACQQCTAVLFRAQISTFLHEDSQFEFDPLRDVQPLELAQ